MTQSTTLILILMAAQSFAAGSTNEAWNAYLAGNFGQVEFLVADAINDTLLSEKELAQYYIALGCSDAMRGRNAGATTVFELALTLDPTIKLTASDLPPPVWKLYEPVRKRIPEYNNQEELSIDSVRYEKVIIQDTIKQFVPIYRDKSTIAKSFICPGWGHLSEDRPRGYLFAGIGMVAVSGWIASAIITDNYRSDYLAARDPDDVSRKYSKYNDFYRLTWGIATVSVVNYLYTQIDLLGKPPPISLDLSNNAFEISLSLKL